MIKNPYRLGHCSTVVRLNNKLGIASFSKGPGSFQCEGILDVKHTWGLFLRFESS